MKVLIEGEGFLAEYANERLSQEYEVIRQKDTAAGIKANPDLALVLQDAWNPAVHKEADKLFRSAGIPWLRAFISFGEGFIGPLVQPGVPGCSQCADHRHFMAGHDRREMRELRKHIQDIGGTQVDAAASLNGILQLAELIVKEAQNFLEGNHSSLQEHVVLLHMRTLAVSRHFFLADPLCPVCGELQDDSPEGARISLQPSPKVSPGSYRSRSIDELAKVLPSEDIHKIAIVAGCGDVVDWMNEAEENGIQAYITGEIHCHIDNEYGRRKYDQMMQFAAATSMSLIGVSHSASEYLVHKTLMKDWFEHHFPIETVLIPQEKWWL